MQIAIAIKEFPPNKIGGAETQTMRMANVLQTRGHDVSVITKRYKSHTSSDENYEIIRMPNFQFNSLFSDLTYLMGCFVYLLWHRSEFDCLQCMMIYPLGFIGLLVNTVVGLPYFAWIRGNDFYVAKDVPWKRWMIRRVLSDALVLVQSSKIEKDVREEFPDLELDIDVLGNGVDFPAVPRQEPSENKVLFVGRFAPKKGLNYLFDAIEELETDCEFILVGDGDQRESLEQRAEKLSTPIYFEGFVPPSNVDQYYQEASILVLPSIEGEGMPNVVLEAMARGVPVVTTDSGGLPSVVKDGQTGYLVPMREPKAIKNALETLLENPDDRCRVGSNAREYIRRHYAWETYIEDLEDVYEKIK